MGTTRQQTTGRRVVFAIASLGCGLLLSAPAQGHDPKNTRLLSEPALSANHIAFVYDGDLWLADRSGANPHRLTSHEGTETSPRFSPDGKTIAFSAQYDGNTDVYIMPVSGGAPRRLTYHPSGDSVEGFTPDGQSVLFSSGRDVFTGRYRRMFTVSLSGGFPKPLPIPNGLRGSFSPDGKRVAYIPIGERFTQWKNYRGGTTSRIWIFDNATHEVQQVRQPAGRCNDTDPVFIGEKVYFRSDRAGEFNLFSFDPRTEAIEQLTHFDEFPVERVTESATELIFEQAGYLHVYDPKNRRATQLKIGVATDLTEKRPRYVSGPEWIRSRHVSPSGARAVFEFRGEIVTVPAEKGDVRNLTSSPGVHERSPAWSPDGSQIAWFSDAGGEYRLHIGSHDGTGSVEQYEVDGHGFYEEPKWSPDGKRISYRDNSWSLYVFDIAAKSSTKIASEPHYGPAPLRGLHHNWSPDSRWITYTVNTDALIQRAFVYNVDQKKSWPVTDGLSEVSEPVFDQSGKYLYFFASTDAGPVKHWFAMSNADMELSNAIYLAVLQDDGENPLARRSDEESPAEKKSESGSGEAGSKTAGDPPAVEIDFEGLDQRIIALPVPAAVHSNLQAGDAGTIYYISRSRDGDRALKRFSLKSRSATDVLAGATDYVLTGDRRKLLYAAGPAWGIAASSGKISPGSGSLRTSAIQVRIDPPAEWLQMFDEVWRINRDYFYDPGMHGADWPAMKARYRPLIADCVTRADVNRVIRWLCAELAVGHSYSGGGDRRQSVDRVPGGLLGADFELADGRYRVKRVFGGLNWNRDLRSPLTEPGVRVAAGEYILAVNGRDLTDSDNIYRHLENTSGKTVSLRVGAKPDGEGARTVKVVPVGSEAGLRNRDWVEGNLRKVHEATDGRVAYVYVPNTTTAGHTYFKRYFFPQTGKAAIIVDERFNGGGQVADYYIDHLRRQYISHWATRYGKDFATPTGAVFGPKVMLIDETAGSGGDLLPWMFNKLELGPLVGKTTWGGLVGVLGFPVLMDGGFVSAPNLAIWTEDGFIVENVGVPPTVEVEQWPKDVIAGRDPQLEKAIEIILKELDANPPREPKKPDYPVRARR